MHRSKWIQRVAVTVGGTVMAAGALPLVTASPAYAGNYYDCVQYLRHKDYFIDDNGVAADSCRVAERGKGSANSLSICASRLESLHVKWEDAKPACLRARP
ncbi:hypothetical protein [Streptomyces lydicus]|uniref:hypothetical protein n=1 Tax=Streptomyces lydicus TaxID=47763 RepID=UPI0010137980|nr:hypothetical protein [Streptomyces lydicus]MCZ1009603.1 hypothetical protein [Streptomyces lydicus]